jgi:hypothetical protein
MKHLSLKSAPKHFPAKADEKDKIIVNPCSGLSGKELKRCEKKYGL